MSNNIILTPAEVDALHIVLSKLVIKKRTGEVGVIHGAERFVSTNVCLRKPDKERLQQVCRKLGLPGGLREINK